MRTGEPLTGRQVHSLVSDEHGLWSVQEALRSWVQVGIVETRSVGSGEPALAQRDPCSDRAAEGAGGPGRAVDRRGP